MDLRKVSRGFAVASIALFSRSYSKKRLCAKELKWNRLLGGIYLRLRVMAR